MLSVLSHRLMLFVLLIVIKDNMNKLSTMR